MCSPSAAGRDIASAFGAASRNGPGSRGATDEGCNAELLATWLVNTSTRRRDLGE